MIISMKEYVHNSKHAAMGCGPMESCELCKAQFGSTVQATDGSEQPLITQRDVVRYVVLGMIGSVVGTLMSELVFKNIFGKNK